MIHDMIIANASGLAVRQDLNQALAALASTSSGATDPSATLAQGGVAQTYPYQFWVDTSLAIPYLKMRTGANDGWVNLGRVDQALFGLNTMQVGTTVPSPLPYQLWVDTNPVGGNPAALLRIRNGANNAWILVGDVTLSNLGHLTLAGGTLSGFLSSSNTDYWKVPVGTSVQRPQTPAVGMLRFNSTLGAFEGYKAGAWSSLGGGGGGGSLQWVEADNAPTPSVDAVGNRVFGFQSGLGQVLYTSVKVPAGYTAGTPVNLYMPFYSNDATGTVQFQVQSTLIRPGTSTFNALTNQRVSSNAAVTLTTPNVPQMIQFDVSSSIGQINGVALQAGDILNLAVMRATDTAPSDAQLLAYIAELTFS